MVSMYMEMMKLELMKADWMKEAVNKELNRETKKEEDVGVNGVIHGEEWDQDMN